MQVVLSLILIVSVPPLIYIYWLKISNDCSTLAVRVPSTIHWIYNGNGLWNGCGIDECYTFGLATDKPVAGNW